jgi:hypothetical protein
MTPTASASAAGVPAASAALTSGTMMSAPMASFEGQECGFRVQGLGFRDSGSRVKSERFRVNKGLGFRV